MFTLFIEFLLYCCAIRFSLLILLSASKTKFKEYFLLVLDMKHMHPTHKNIILKTEIHFYKVPLTNVILCAHHLNEIIQTSILIFSLCTQ